MNLKTLGQPVKPMKNIALPPLKLFNTESRSKEPVIPIEKNHIKMYTCGPTVYDYAHIGNFRTYVFEDLLRRTIKFFGMEITQVMNITDVDDKTIRGATKKGITLKEYTTPYTKAFFDDLDALGIERVEQYPAATDYIPEMIVFIEKLIDKGYAYQGSDKSIYYKIDKFKRYGCLSHLKLDELKTHSKNVTHSDEYDKDHISDFVLWKAYQPERDGSIFWESPFGPGRPGWHLECSTMAMNILGETLDIHVGGVDNMFPHHENEIAQSEACSGKQFAKIWLHSEHLLVDNKKMSKSLGNFYTFRDLLDKGYTGKQVRYMLLQTHYKTQLNFTLEGLEGAKGSLQRIHHFVDRIQRISDDATPCNTNQFNSLLETSYKLFTSALSDDLNISVALASLFDLIRDGNALLDAKTVNKKQAEELLKLLMKFDQVLGVIDFEPLDKQVPLEILHLAKERDIARKEKKWDLADKLRDQITQAGYALEDSPKGSIVRKIDF